MLDHFFPLLFSKDSESLKILDIRFRELGAKRPLNGTSKVNTRTDGRTDRHTHRRTFRLIENALKVVNGAFSHKIDYITIFKEIINWWSFIGKGLRSRLFDSQETTSLEGCLGKAEGWYREGRELLYCIRIRTRGGLYGQIYPSISF